MLDYLSIADQRQASDIFLATGLPVQYRHAGQLKALSDIPLTYTMMASILKQLLTDNQQTQLRQQQGIDCAWTDPHHRRYRVYGFLQQQGVSFTLRRLPNTMPDFTTLRLPNFWDLLTPPWTGLIVVTGPTGSGKTHTLAALINELLQRQALHLITLEDPIEIQLTSSQGLIQQCEFGIHFNDFSQALRGLLRADPDVIVIGEIRDLTTMRLALTAAQTGHLVITTLHTHTADQAVTRILHLFDDHEQTLVRESLAQTLRLIIAQRLVKTNHAQRIAVIELLNSTPAIEHSIRTGKFAQLYSLMQTGQQQNMWTFEQYLRQLVTNGDISSATFAAAKPRH